MSDEIKPALTAEEWRTSDLTELPRYLIGEENAAWVAAAANHALPAGHPLKITRADLAAVREAEELYGDVWGATMNNPAEDDKASGDVYFALQRLAAKLAALLPPEGQPNA